MFYNITARRRSIKNPTEEYNRICDVVTRYSPSALQVLYKYSASTQQAAIFLYVDIHQAFGGATRMNTFMYFHLWGLGFPHTCTRNTDTLVSYCNAGRSCVFCVRMFYYIGWCIYRYAVHNADIGFSLKKQGSGTADVKTPPGSTHVENIRLLYGAAIAKYVSIIAYIISCYCTYV